MMDPHKLAKSFLRAAAAALLALPLIALSGCAAPQAATDISDALLIDAAKDILLRAEESAEKDRIIMQAKADEAFQKKAETFEQLLLVSAIEAGDPQLAAEQAARDTVLYLNEQAEVRASVLAETQRLGGTSLALQADADAIRYAVRMKTAERNLPAKTLEDFKTTGVLEIVLAVVNEAELLNAPDLLLTDVQRADKAALIARRAAEAKRAQAAK